MAAMETPTLDVLGTLAEDSGTVAQRNEPRPLILSVSESETDHISLRRVIDDTHWRLSSVRTCHDALERLSYSGALAAFCECSLPDGTWKDILELTLTKQQRCVLVVTTTFADERLWSEVLHFGGYEVLTKPFIRQDVLRVLDSIWKLHTGPVRGARTFCGAP
jgi:DNA-binding NtrC family response regulator